MTQETPYIGDVIRLRREFLGWSQAELAKRAETSQQTVDRVERNLVQHSRALVGIKQALGLIPKETREDMRIMDLADALGTAARRFELLAKAPGLSSRAVELCERYAAEARAACQEPPNDRAEDSEALPDLQR